MGSEYACGVRTPRKIFAEIGMAVGRAELSKLYVSGKLVVPGHQPVPDPGSRPERSRKLIKAMLKEPLKHLSMNSEGFLVIPSQEELSKLCPVTLDDEQKQEFQNLRTKYPRLTADTTVDGSTEAGGSAAGNSPDSEGAGKASPPTLPPGTQVESEEDLKDNFGDEILSQKPLPEGNTAATREIFLCLTATQAAVGDQKVWRLWLQNKAPQPVNVPAGTFLGQGGQGSFTSLVTSSVEEVKVPFAWKYTRISAFKKDTAEQANGFVIFNKDGVTPLQGKPKCVLLSDVEAEVGNNLTLYGHSITRGGNKVTITPSPTTVVWAPDKVFPGGEVGEQGGGSGVSKFKAEDALGQFLRSHEDTIGVPRCKGLARPVFVMKLAQASRRQGPVLIPGPPNGQSILLLFTTKKIEVPGNGFVFLG